MPARPISKLSRLELSNLNAFLMVEQERSFTKAAVELGVTTSALSHSIKNLEQNLGVRLLHRTSRNVAPTEVGSLLAERLRLSLGDISDALDDISAFRDKPKGRLRLSVLGDGANLILAKHLPSFLKNYPDIEVEIDVDNKMVDIVSAGFDAGIRHDGSIPADLVAIKLGTQLKWVTVASPVYLAQAGIPQIPEDLKQHNCIQMRIGSGAMYKWDFEKEGEIRVIEVPGQICMNETSLILEMARADIGIAYVLEKLARPYIEKGELQEVLPDWSTIDPPMFLYYPGHRTIPPALKELAAFLREAISNEE